MLSPFLVSRSNYPWTNNPLITDAWVVESDFLSGSLILGSPINTWAQQKGSTGPLTNTSSSIEQPTLSYGWGRSNRPSLLFDGSNDHMICDALAAKVVGDDVPFTVIMQVRLPIAPVTSRYFCAFGATASVSFGYHGYYFNNARTFSAQRAGDSGAAINITTTQTLNIGQLYVLTYVFTGTTLIVRQNGAFTSLNGTAINTVAAATINRFTLAALRQTGLPSTFGNFWIRSLIFAPSALPASSYLPIENYMMAQNALT